MRIYRFALILMFSLLYFGCSGGAEESSNTVVSAETTPVAEATPLPQFTDANEALAVGNQLLETGETDKAIEALNQAVALNPDLAEAYFKLGIAHSLIEIRNQTAEMTVAETPTPSPTPRGKKAEEEKSESEKAFEKAVEAYKKLIKANDEDHSAHYNLGRAYNKLNEDEDAAKALKQAVKLNPEDTEYQTELGAILIKLAQYDQAVPALKKAVELDPGNIKAEELLADAEAGRKRINYSTVKKEDKRAEKRTPDGDGESPEAKTSPTPQPIPKKEVKPKPSP